MTKLHKNLAALLAMILLVFACAPAAMAQSSQDGYVPPGPNIIDDTEEQDVPPPPPTIDDDDSELPFTGLDLGLVAVAGGSLFVLGLGMRRLTRSPDGA